MTRENCAQRGAKAGQGLMNRHTGAAWVGENRFHLVVQQTLHENIGPRLELRGFIAHRSRTPRHHHVTSSAISLVYWPGRRLPAQPVHSIRTARAGMAVSAY